MNHVLDEFVVAETVLSHVDGAGGRLVVRGHELEDIAGRSFEAVLALLWDGLTRDAPSGEEEIRAVLRAAAGRGSVLEVNTTRGAEPQRGLCPGPTVLRWWVEVGGRSVSLGSDAHDPERIVRGFELASGHIEAAGFRPNDDPAGYWLR